MNTKVSRSMRLITLLGKSTLHPNNLNELLAYIKQNARKMNIAHAGIGSVSHLCGLLFMSTIQQDMQTTAYHCTNSAMTGLQAGEVDLLCDQTTNKTTQIQSGKVRAYDALRNKLQAEINLLGPIIQKAGVYAS